MKQRLLFLSLVVMLLGVGIDGWGQTPNGSLSFGTTANSTTATTGNTGFGGIRIGTGSGSFTIMNSGQEIGTDAELRGIAPTGGSINSVGITSTEYGSAATTFTLAFEIYLSGGSSGTWYFFAGNGAGFAAAQSATFTGSQVFTGLRWVFGTSNAITTMNRNAGAWNATGISGTPFAQLTSYTVTIVGNNSASSVNYGSSQSVAVNTYDLWVNGVLVGNDLAKAQLPAETTINAFRFYGENSTGNVATIALDNIRWWNTCVAPSISLYSSISDLPSNSYTDLHINGGDATMTGNSTISREMLITDGSLTVGNTNQLTISGTLTNSVGATGLVIESDATGTGSLIHSTAGVAATVERYIPGVSNAWHLLGSPVAAQDISGDWIAGNYDFYAYDEASATWLNQKVGGNNITSFTPGQGYLVAYETAALTKSFSGNLNNGNIVVAVTKDGTGDHAGANLLANPYASGIDWNTATRTLFADNFAYVYDQTANAGTGAFTAIDGGSGNAWIAPHQGFFVLAQSAGDFTFSNTMREHGGTYTKNGTTDENILAIRLSGETSYDVTRIRIKEDASTLRDRSDAIKFYSYTPNVPQIYSQSEDGKNLTLNSIPQISNESSVQIGMLIAETGSYTLNIESALGQFAAEKIYVEDTHLGMSHNLSENGAYSFVATPGDNPNRFLLHFGAVGVSEQPASAALKAYVVGGQLYFPLQGEATLEIVDVQGRVLQQSKVSGQGLASQPLQLPAGAYVVRLTSGQSAQTAKVIVK